MKRYLAFKGDTYYPAGGWDDFKGDFDTAGEAFDAVRSDPQKWSWWHVIDTQTKQEVQEVTLEGTP